MSPRAEEFQWVRDDLAVWGCYSPAEKAGANSCAILCKSGVLLIDPLRLGDGAFKELSAVARPWAVALTGGGVRRGADFFGEHHGLELLAPDSPALAEAGFQIVPMEGATPGEVSFYHPERGLLVVGEAVNNTGQGLAPLPKRLQTNPKLFSKSLARLASLPFAICCFAHGEPVVATRNNSCLDGLFSNTNAGNVV